MQLQLSTDIALPALCFIAVALVFVGGGFFAAFMLRRKGAAPSSVAYECGEAPIGSPWVSFVPYYAIVALVFLLFEVELIFLLPWATFRPQQFASNAATLQFAQLAVYEGLAFIFILAIGLLFVWAKGFLNSVSSNPTPAKWASPVPQNLYLSLYQSDEVADSARAFSNEN